MAGDSVANVNSNASLELIPTCGDADQARPVRATPVRFAVLLSAACFMFGNYYFFDQTSATQDALMNSVGMSENTFGLLASVYSWPNVILPLFGGMFIDRMGVRIASFFFTTLVLLGSLLFSLGLWVKSVPMLVVARVLFGFGGESQNVASLSFISKWFAGRELAFALAINVSVSRLGSVAVFDSQPALIQAIGVTGGSWVTTCVCGLSLLSASIAATIDWRADHKDSARGLALAAGETDAAASLADMRKLGLLYSLVSVSCVTVYVSAFPFMQVVSAPYLKQRFGFEEAKADSIVSNINLVSAFLSPLLGLFVDRFGRRPLLLVLSSVCFGCCHLGFLLWPECYHCQAIIGLYMLMGAAISVYGSVIWPCVPLVVDQDIVGTAFGLTTALQNLGMAISPMILTKLHSSTGSFTLPFLYIIACCVVGSIAGVVIWIVDGRRGQKLAGGGEAPAA
mmetsp:Transcript_2194/g.4888  ORF Transcript_2194/g.4888 Transcript_2194/m.4888 type:complete len:454 (-) Transcript_2194:84-1445(-)